MSFSRVGLCGRTRLETNSGDADEERSRDEEHEDPDVLNQSPAYL